jgi:hypothetical protein
MPQIKSHVETAASFEKTPGRWLCEIRPTVTSRDGQKTLAGVEIKTNKNGHEMWRVIAIVIDEHPEAPHGAWIFENLSWDEGKAETRIYGLLKCLGHPVDEWKRTGHNCTPADLFHRSFVFDVDLETDQNGNTNLRGRGFLPFAPATAKRGPHPSKGTNGGAAPAGSPSTATGTSSTGAASLPPREPAPPTTGKLPF